MDLNLIYDIFVTNREIYEEVKSERKGVLRVLRGPVGEWNNLNRNKRLYSEKLWDRTLASSYVKEQLLYKTLYGECNHPENRMEVDFSRVSHVIWDMWKVPESNQIYAEIAILDTPLGRILNTLYEAGGIIGYSSRAGGTLHRRKDYIEVDENDYNFITFDAVPYPSVVSARPQEVLESVIEGVNVELPKEVHDKLCSVIKESGLENRDVIKDFIYSIKGFNLEKEIQLLESASYTQVENTPKIEQPVKSETESKSLETTLSLLKESSLQINNLRVENQSLTTDNAALKVENETLKTNLNESLSRITELMNDSKSMSQDSSITESRLNDTIVELRGRISELEGIIEDRDLEISELSDVREACKVLRQENDGIKSSLKALNEQKLSSDESVLECTKIRNELQDAYEEISSMVSESNAKDEKINQLTESVKQLEEQLKDAEHEKESMIKESVEPSVVKNLRLENAELNTKIKNLSESVSSLNDSNVSIHEKCKQYKEDLVSVICSGYNLNPQEILNKLPVGFTKSDIYNICEGMTNSVVNGLSFDSVVIEESNNENIESNPNSPEVSTPRWLFSGANRRGLGTKK